MRFCSTALTPFPLNKDNNILRDVELQDLVIGNPRKMQTTLIRPLNGS